MILAKLLRSVHHGSRERKMGVFEMVVLIVFIGCLTGMVDSYFKSKAKSKQQDGVTECIQRIEALEQKLRGNLEKRIANLEDLLTDREFEFDRRLRGQDERRDKL